MRFSLIALIARTYRVSGDHRVHNTPTATQSSVSPSPAARSRRFLALKTSMWKTRQGGEDHWKGLEESQSNDCNVMSPLGSAVGSSTVLTSETLNKRLEYTRHAPLPVPFQERTEATWVSTSRSCVRLGRRRAMPPYNASHVNRKSLGTMHNVVVQPERKMEVYTCLLRQRLLRQLRLFRPVRNYHSYVRSHSPAST